MFNAKNLSLLALGGGLLVGAWLFWSNANDQHSAHEAWEAAGPEAEKSALRIPDYSEAAARGRLVFNQNCSVCHGRDAAGGTAGPPLIHKYYEPSHHADGAIRLAIRNGVIQHHWKFGNMPPVAGVAPQQEDQIIAFIRETQRANGID